LANDFILWSFCGCSLGVYPLVVAAHPQEPDQFAVGLKDGAVIVFEPPISAGKWSMLTAYENGSASKIPAESEANHKLISENSEYENYAQTLAGQVSVNTDVCLCNE
jgi:hypothetical protein